jgi:hypothetical protein
MRGQLGNKAASDIEKARFCTNLLGIRYKILSGSGTGAKAGTGNKNFSRNSEPEPLQIITVPQHC